MAGSLKNEKDDAPAAMEANAAAKLFEEVKVMFRDLPDRLQSQLLDGLGPRIRRKHRLHPMMVMDMVHSMEESEDRALGWLMAMSVFKDDAPWLYEIGRDVYEAVRTNDPETISTAIERFDRSLRSMRRTPMARELMGYPEIDMLVHELGSMARHLFLRPPGESSSKAATAKTGKKNDSKEQPAVGEDNMAAYYVVTSIVILVPVVAATALVIHALNKKGDVSAGFQLSKFGFTLTAKDRNGDSESVARRSR